MLRDPPPFVRACQVHVEGVLQAAIATVKIEYTLAMLKIWSKNARGVEELILLLSENDEVVVVAIRELGEGLEVVLGVEAFVGKVTRQVRASLRVEHGVEVAPIVMDVVIIGVEVLTVSLKVAQLVRK